MSDRVYWVKGTNFTVTDISKIQQLVPEFLNKKGSTVLHRDDQLLKYYVTVTLLSIGVTKCYAVTLKHTESLVNLVVRDAVLHN